MVSELFLTHFGLNYSDRLNKLPQTIFWTSQISILGMSGYAILVFLEKMAKLFANSGDPDQMPHSAGSDLSLPYLAINLFGSLD